jgi:uridine phosphorylase
MREKEQYQASELILNQDNSVYHLGLKGEHIADIVLLVGDQGRVQRISKYFDEIEFEVQNREFKTHTGWYKGKRVSVISTGIGTDNIDIVLNELDAAVNIDPSTRIRKQTKRVLKLIRLGTSGAIHPQIPVDSFVISKFGLGLDGLLYYYADTSDLDEETIQIEQRVIRHLKWNKDLAKPYVRKSDDSLFSSLEEGMISGITVSATGFYGPQGRQLHLELKDPTMREVMANFTHADYRITNLEMETSAIYGLGHLLGHQCCSCNAILANRSTGDFTKDHSAIVEALIQNVLHKIETNL